ncbi:MAG: peptide chain release factor-like protein [Syntrophales bacterium]|jgi:protein subunit release factor B|nr:peptide chain release factor-like protein [Syntrophales bacterium]MCK9527043.1 peptide chain release factor-like protein [Syntrophales bacterium]MDX9921832.1 peptide chain release factor-like protein [Syntrophales bacterium]
MFTVTEAKEQELKKRMAKLGVCEDDLRETFVRSSGPGGQKVNKTSSCVHLLHIPTGLAVKCRRERSQALNRFFARRLLMDRIERMRDGIVSAERQRIEKMRRQKRKRSGRAKEKVLEAKRRQSEKKELRKPPVPDV